ncbi:putative Alpha-expansin 13 precursor [Hibiscus syriacus]|uniref:Alpha-expansin 13 n=1 Tax=Hibiscus syriacus TaxID=106335 RepID=A0A6A2YZK1_HIBSY|nr:putative Alpha-expansin 13 precursor [Hibiscus syriacus]
MKMNFVWAAYVVNLTNLITDYKSQKSCPDVMAMGAGLWDMLHFNNASDYEFALRMLKNKVVSLLPLSTKLAMNEPVVGSVPIKSSSHLFWLGLPVLINGMLNTEEKREKMSDAVWHAYDRALGDSKLLRQNGGPLLLLDSQSLTWNCGPHCISDVSTRLLQPPGSRTLHRHCNYVMSPAPATLLMSTITSMPEPSIVNQTPPSFLHIILFQNQTNIAADRRSVFILQGVRFFEKARMIRPEIPVACMMKCLWLLLTQSSSLWMA